MNAVLLQKIEELTLYTIEQEKALKTQLNKIEKLETENGRLENVENELAEIKELLNQLNN